MDRGQQHQAGTDLKMKVGSGALTALGQVAQSTTATT